MKTIQTISKLVARDLGISEKLVDSINDFYWKDVRRTLSSMGSSSVSLKHIGTITTSKRKIDWFIKQTIGKIRSIRISTRYKESTVAILLDYHFDRLRKALKQRNILATQYYETYTSRIKRVRESVVLSEGELIEDNRGALQPSEDGAGDASGGTASGDSEA